MKTKNSYGTVSIYDRLGGKLIGQVLHLSTDFKVKDGDYVEYGQPLGIQSGTGAAGTVTYAVHAHVELEKDQFVRYIADIASGAISPESRTSRVNSNETELQFPLRKADGSHYQAEELFAMLEKEPSGHYLLGSHGFWHGGIHFSDVSAPQCVGQQPIRCIADGEVVAYRLNKNYLESTYTSNSQCTNLRYSSSFCLVRHEYCSPPNKSEGADKGKQNRLAFYSLYMHLLPYERYAEEAEQELQRVKVINGGWPARNLPLEESGSEVLGMIPTGTEFDLLEERDTSDGRYRFARGRISKGQIGSRKEGDDVWFASRENGQPIKNGAGKARLQDVLPPGKSQPGYWQGKVRATITAASGVKVRNAPTGEQGGSQVFPNQVLCLGSIVEFDSDKVQWLQLEDGKKYPMAECTFVPGQGGLKGAGTLPSTFWLCVEDTGKGKMLSRDRVVPSSFDSVVSPRAAIKVGDPIGYMGLYETPTASGGRSASRHQVHIEVFTGDTQLQAFLNNQAGLTEGRQYLRLPANTELADRSVLDAEPSLLPVKGYALQREHVVPLDKSPTAKDSQGQEWHQVTVLENRQTITGMVKKLTNASSGAEVICQYDLEKLGFRIVEERNSNSDGFLDPENMPAFFRELYNEIDQLGDSNGKVSQQELKAALRDPDLRERWSKLIALHPTEWQAKSDDAKWKRLEKYLENSPELLRHEKERIDNLVWWGAATIIGFPNSPVIYHIHPVALVEGLRIKESEESDLMYLARTLYGEARGQNYASKVAVAWIIRNRLNTGRWGKTYRSVVTARLQFTCWSQSIDPHGYKAIHNPQGVAWSDCQNAALEVMNAAASANVLPNALYYYSPTAQAQLHAAKPDTYPETPPFAISSKRVYNPPGVRDADYRFYKN
ncbi:cell wall hydrolase [Pseudomonas resinovorans]|uniref:Cell wall hydrolase n=1 Tax=Metapseudomonas resinovorans TaxID=53412 RepID=A0ABT4YDJ3_METRE|nr:cell wall hydrolase [Pseudomonas resinovorans]MDA8486836.1 cell wall hydrolase [Pseudomonas resinovorans]